MLAPNCSLENAKQLAESVRSVIESSAFRDAGREIRLTVSLGIATAKWPHEPHDASTLVSCADRRLYDAKSSGRNTWRAESAEPVPTRGKPGRGVFSRLSKIFAAEAK